MIYFMKSLIFGIAFIIVATVFAVLLEVADEIVAPTQTPVTNFEDCVAAGFPVMESYPRKCRTSDDKVFTEDIGDELSKLNVLRLHTPRPNALVQSPLVVSGDVRGTWFFEGNFPIVLLDNMGNELSSTYAMANGEWMTEEFVPFSATLEFGKGEWELGTLSLIKANPSGLAEHDDEFHIPIRHQ